MTDQEELRDDVPPEPDGETWQMGDPPEEGREGDQQDPGIDEPERTEEGASRPAEPEWKENEPSPHQGEEDQEPV